MLLCQRRGTSRSTRSGEPNNKLAGRRPRSIGESSQGLLADRLDIFGKGQIAKLRAKVLGLLG